MTEAAHETLIIVRRHDEEEHEAHSSAWKVAHADFMTAMMAFFLIMWLINVTDEEIRKGISEYFNPVHLSQGQSEQKGLNRPDDAGEKKTAQKGPSLEQPQKQQGGDQVVSEAVSHDETSTEQQAAEEQGVPASAGSGALPNQGTGPAAVSGEPPGEAVERAAFQDPYVTLARLANTYDADHPANADYVIGDDREPGVVAGEVDRDPFDPVYWQTAKGAPVRSTRPGSAGASEKLPAALKPDSMGPLTESVVAPADETTPPPSEAVASAAEAVAAQPPPKAAEAVPAEPEKAAAAVGPLAEDPAKAIATTAAAVGAALDQAVRQMLGSSPAPQISVTATGEGVLIDLTDDTDFSMFKIGSAIPNARLVKVMEEVARILKTQPGAIVLRGHTDGRPFRSDVYDNWRLSAARAHMAYYMLVRGGLAEARFEKIEGYADRDLKNPSVPYADENRRIEILLKGSAT